MTATTFEIPGLVLLTPRVFTDDRGWFMESYSESELAKHGITVRFVQDNHSWSRKNVLRGLHFQKPPHAQDKLVRVTRGEVTDVAVDVRAGSPTFGKYVAVTLSEENKQMFFIPKGFAHGFVTRTDDVDLEYKVSDFYDAATDGGVRWDDPALGIPWNVKEPIVSAKDAALPLLKDIGEVFAYAE